MEVFNKDLVWGLKINLDHIGGSWVKEFSSILWSYRTTPWKETSMTSFHLVYGEKVVALVEIRMSST